LQSSPLVESYPTSSYIAEDKNDNQNKSEGSECHIYIKVLPAEGWLLMRDWMWFLTADSMESKNSSLTRVNLWARLALANSNANCLHLERQMYLNLYGARLTAPLVSSDDGVVKSVSLMFSHYSRFENFVNPQVFYGLRMLCIEISYVEVQKKQGFVTQGIA
jgi:hypothetical protein